MSNNLKSKPNSVSFFWNGVISELGIWPPLIWPKEAPKWPWPVIPYVKLKAYGLSAPPATSEIPALNLRKETASPKSSASDNINDKVADV